MSMSPRWRLWRGTASDGIDPPSGILSERCKKDVFPAPFFSFPMAFFILPLIILTCLSCAREKRLFPHGNLSMPLNTDEDKLKLILSSENFAIGKNVIDSALNKDGIYLLGLNGRADTPSKVILTGSMVPSAANSSLSMQTTRLFATTGIRFPSASFSGSG